jgi:vitamin B12 transporter
MSVPFSRARAGRRVLPLAPSLAQPAPEVSLGTVTITATRDPSHVTDVVSKITVLDRETLDRSSGRTLVELLSQQPGLQFTSNGGLGKSASLFTRGLEARHTLLLADGIRVGPATLGTPSLDNLPLEAVERIEIVRGPMSSLYGSDAVGGVVQTFTRRGRFGSHPNAKMAAGSKRYDQLAGGIAFGSGDFDAAVQVEHTEAHGFSATNARAPFGNHSPDEDGFRQDGGSVRAGWQATPDWRVEALALQSDGTTRYDDGPGADSKARPHNRLLSSQASGRVGDTLDANLSAAQSVDAYETLATASAFASLGTIETVQKQFAWATSLAALGAM